MTWHLINRDLTVFDTGSVKMASKAVCESTAEFWNAFTDGQVFWFCLGYV